MYGNVSGSEPPHKVILHLDPDGTEFFNRIKSYLNSQDCFRVTEAFEMARLAHGDQTRKSGELFFTHPLTVAYYLAEYRLDAPALMAALLHDVAEDTRVSLTKIEARFGREVRRLVDGVTKLKEVSAGVGQNRQLTPQEIQDASLHKLFDAMIVDVRVVLIKLFDRLHNMRTIKALPLPKQHKKARETLDVYAPLANRLGIWRLKTELEALSLEVIDPEAYWALKRELDRQRHKQQAAYNRISKQIFEQLTRTGVPLVNVHSNPESLYSIYQSIQAGYQTFSSVDSTLRLVVMVEDVPSCYLALGYLHQMWQPVPGRFDDYIARPRVNLYRALHTTVMASNGEPLKLRIRTVPMHSISEIGVLTSWFYAGTPLWSKAMAERVDALFDNVRQNIDLEPQDVGAGVQGVVEDLFGKQIMVYTPRGDVLELPLGATAVDFAYAIHTEVGNQCQSAYVDDKPYPLNRPLRDGVQVRILKSGWARPYRTWLDEDLGFLTTNRARSHIRRWFRRLPKRIAQTEGKRILQDELTMLGLPKKSHDEVAAMFGFEKSAQLYHALGHAELLPTTVATQVLETDWNLEPLRNIGQLVHTLQGEEFLVTNASGRPLRLCQACNARPGDEIVGFLRSNGVVTVHKAGCHTLRPDPLADRTIKLGWGREGSDQVRLVSIEIHVYDRYGLLFEISELLRDENVNISTINTSPHNGDGNVHLLLELEVASPRVLVRILHRAHALVNVYAVRCQPRQGLPERTKYRPE